VRAIVDGAEYQQELLKKIHEEATALAHVRTRTEFLDEYADLMVVLDALTAELEISEADIQVAIKENVVRKGLYKQRHYLHWSADSDYTSNETPQGIKD
jgi:phosphoribosyl-ATP pyrophosphohydrolase